MEYEWLAELESVGRSLIVETDSVNAIRARAAKDRLPPVYRWAAKQASLDELRHFLAVEGGPDARFDDLVALCQVGLAGAPKRKWPVITGTRWATAAAPGCTPICTAKWRTPSSYPKSTGDRCPRRRWPARRSEGC